MSLLEVKSLSKDYGRGRGAFDVSFELLSGRVVGFIGPNGAGKSTTLNMISGFIKPDSGSMKLFDTTYDWHSVNKLYKRIGVLRAEVAFDPDLSARRIFAQNSFLLGMDLKNRWIELSELLDLDLNKPFKKLSLGNKKKVGVIDCLLHEPEVVIMDEPTSGLDPLIQYKVMSLLRQRAEKGGAVLLSSHTLSEVQSFCDDIIMIKDGKVILSGQTSTILRQSQRRFVVNGLSEVLLNRIKRERLINNFEIVGGQSVLYSADYTKLMQMLVHNEIFDFYVERPTLEETFTEMYNKES